MLEIRETLEGLGELIARILEGGEDCSCFVCGFDEVCRLELRWYQLNGYLEEEAI